MTPKTTPYTRGDICRIADVSAPVVKNLVRGRVLRKRGKGAGHHNQFSEDDGFRVEMAKALLAVGIDVRSIREVFAAIDKPSLPDARPWVWLRGRERLTVGAKLCLVTEHPKLPAGVGAACLVSDAGAYDLVEQSRGRCIVIDVNTIIEHLEVGTGVPYSAADPDEPPERVSEAV